MFTIALDREELSTVLAALRYWQENGLADDPYLRSDALHEIATDGGELTSLCSNGIDRLCERINTL